MEFVIKAPNIKNKIKTIFAHNIKKAPLNISDISIVSKAFEITPLYLIYKIKSSIMHIKRDIRGYKKLNTLYNILTSDLFEPNILKVENILLFLEKIYMLDNVDNKKDNIKINIYKE